LAAEPIKFMDDLDRIWIARQAMVNRERAIVAYALQNRSHGPGDASVANDMQMLLQGVISSGAPFATSSRALFLNAEHQTLLHTHWGFLRADKTVISVAPVPGHEATAIAASARVLERLRTEGFGICFSHHVVAPAYRSWQRLGQYVKCDPAQFDTRALPSLFAAVRARTPAQLIAENVQSAAQYERLANLGVERFLGDWFATPEVVKLRLLSPGEISAKLLIGVLQRNAPLDEVVQVLEKDTALAIGLLRVLNATSMTVGARISTLRQAALLLGYERLKRWAHMLRFLAAPERISPLAVTSLARARMMHLLALRTPGALDSGTAFLIGLLSQIDHILGMPMLQSLSQLYLDPAISNTLLENTGPYANILQLTLACESRDAAAFDRAYQRLDISLRQVSQAHRDALAWADAMG